MDSYRSDQFSLKEQYSWEELVSIMAYLRSEQGCPWDRKQTHQSLRANFLEETYEALDAVDSGCPDRLADELGDVLLQVLFHAQIAADNHEFTIQDVLNQLAQKLIRRHTHIFGNDRAGTEEEALKSWNQNKQLEKGFTRASDALLDVPRSIPALSRADKIQKRAAKAGFDWDSPDGAKDKIYEELDELETAEDRAKQSPEAEMEAGDLLFAAVNYLRHLKVDPELALNRSSDKFVARFCEVERLVLADSQEMDQLSLAELDRYWDLVKEKEKSQRTED